MAGAAGMTFMDPVEVMRLAVIAAHLSGYSLPSTPPPRVMELDSAQMHRVTCAPDAARNDTCFDDIGTYDDGDGIVIDVQFARTHPDLPEDAIVIHELTHWLQYEHAWGGDGCPHMQERENEAYRVENLYLRDVLHSSFMQFAPIVCP
jgi:hypothetical protein